MNAEHAAPDRTRWTWLAAGPRRLPVYKAVGAPAPGGRGPEEKRALDARAAEDARVIRRCQEGDLAAFEELVRRYMADALRLAGGYLRDREEALDASQDAFVSALEALPRFRPGEPFFPWFHAILRNACLGRLRRLRRRGEVPLDEATARAAPAREPGSAGEAAAVGRALAALSAEHREALVLRHWEGMGYEAIAEALGVPLGTVMSRLHYARRALRSRLEGTGGVEA